MNDPEETSAQKQNATGASKEAVRAAVKSTGNYFLDLSVAAKNLSADSQNLIVSGSVHRNSWITFITLNILPIGALIPDTIYLRDGRVISNVSTRMQGRNLVIESLTGSVTLPLAQVARIERGPLLRFEMPVPAEEAATVQRPQREDPPRKTAEAQSPPSPARAFLAALPVYSPGFRECAPLKCAGVLGLTLLKTAAFVKVVQYWKPRPYNASSGRTAPLRTLAQRELVGYRADMVFDPERSAHLISAKRWKGRRAAYRALFASAVALDAGTFLFFTSVSADGANAGVSFAL